MSFYLQCGFDSSSEKEVGGKSVAGFLHALHSQATAAAMCACVM